MCRDQFKSGVRTHGTPQERNQNRELSYKHDTPPHCTTPLARTSWL